MDLEEMIAPNRDFQTSINIDFDFADVTKIEGLIPTDAVCRYIEEIVRDVLVKTNQRAKLLVGAYGKGKSHIVLAALSAMWLKEPVHFARIIEAYESRGLEFGNTFSSFVSEGKRLLPVVITGSTADLRHSLLHALRNALKKAGLEELMPDTNYDGAIRVLNRWRGEYPGTAEAFAKLTGMSIDAAVSGLRNLNTQVYDAFVGVYPCLTSGSTFAALDGADVLEVYENVLGGLVLHRIDGIYIVYDEFSKFLESNIERATIEDIKLLQDLAELCNRSGLDRQLHLLLISHKSLSNYIDSRLPKEKVDGWRGVSGRFREIEMLGDASQYYELMEHAIVKDEAKWREWLEQHDRRNANLLERLAERYTKQGLFEANTACAVASGCFPLHPLSAYLLPRMSEKVAQNERTLFTFLCSSEEHSLCDALAVAKGFVTPDCLYDYFEPQLRKEYYASPLHHTYELVQSSLRHVEPGGLDARIIKTIAAIDVVAQYDRVAPTRETLVDLYTDCGYDSLEVEASIERLVESKSIVYLRRSNAFLKLKEPSGEPIEARLAEREARIRSSRSCTWILNAAVHNEALYPSRYNEERGVVRYFSCGFISASSLLADGLECFDFEGDGAIVAVHVETPDERDELMRLLAGQAPTETMVVISVAKQYANVDAEIYRLEAARQLKEEAGEDDVLAEEYEVVIEDYSEVVGEYIDGFFRPELGRALYYARGERLDGMTRKRQLSEMLSELCFDSYANTPCITSEALNKNELTGTAYSSRTKILKSLCGRSIEPNLGFVGNGQETSMARSAFEMTGIFKDLSEARLNPSEDIDEKTQGVLVAIRRFVERANGSSFEEIYDTLTGLDDGIGLRKGPIPLYLAFVLRDYRDEIAITHGKEERELTEGVLNDIAADPKGYRLTRLNWTPEMAEYVAGVGEVFGCDSAVATRSGAAEAIRLWYAGLPQMTRNSLSDHAKNGEPRVAETRLALFKAIRRYDASPDSLLFGELPKAFNANEADSELVDELRCEKEQCDGYLDATVTHIADNLKALFDSDAHEDATLGSVLHDWVELNPVVSTHVFSGVSNQVINVIRQANGDDAVTVCRLAKAATALRVEDWNDARFKDFYRIVKGVKDEVESQTEASCVDAGGAKLGIVIINEDGTSSQKTFAAVECGSRSRLLRSSIVACLSEMGGALSPEEKRQVVFEVLEELC